MNFYYITPYSFLSLVLFYITQCCSLVSICTCGFECICVYVCACVFHFLPSSFPADISCFLMSSQRCLNLMAQWKDLGPESQSSVWTNSLKTIGKLFNCS